MKKTLTFILISLLTLLISGCGDSSNEDVSTDSKKYIGYVTLEGNNLTLDEFEFIKQDDKERMEELGLTESDMPNGYYIYNESDETQSFTLDEQTEFTFFDTGNLFVSEEEDKKYTTTNIEEFKQFLYGDSNTPIQTPFWVDVQDGKVISVEEEFVN
jgi:hypothetical protein